MADWLPDKQAVVLVVHLNQGETAGQSVRPHAFCSHRCPVSRLKFAALGHLMRAQEQVQLLVGPGGGVQEDAVARRRDARRVAQESPAVQVL